jgi:glycosyltransferase involved in cell wall biosynthesis
MMIKDRDIVVVGIQPWDIEIGSNCKNIAIEMAKNNRVLYVNSPLDRISAFKGRKSPKVIKRLNVIKGKDEGIRQITDNLYEFYPATVFEPVNRISIKGIFEFFNKINAKRFAEQINKAIKKLGIKNYILFNDSSMFLGKHFDQYLDYDTYIYYIRDNLVNSPFPYWNTHGKRVEPQTIKKADVVVTNSIYYADYARQYNPQSYMVGQGCDTSLFDDKKRHIDVAPELKEIPQPIIGYVGSIAHIRLDVNLLIHIAKVEKEWQLVLVGPEDDVFKASELHQLENVHFLGSKPENRLPEFIKGFDICINPQILNITTIGNYPRKIDEYLAMGKPVLATKTKAMEYFAEHTYLAEDKTGYVELIAKALKENNPELEDKRREYALSHSWENNVKEIWKAVEKAKK